AVVKKALAIMGEDVGVSRYPIQFSAQDEDNIRNILSQFSQ
ncbi:dihydrodipicolinate synthase family protein, partial [Pantoea agglomerans]|nr:dihydrodipicolinate synthase family protein [Pantoea agglomerans]